MNVYLLPFQHSVMHMGNEPRRYWRGSLVLLLCIITASPARQIGMERSVRVHASTSYFDILRQHSDRFAITSFASSSIGTITLANSSDAFTISLRRNRTHTAFENRQAQWRTLTATNLGSLDVDWTGPVGPVFAAAGLRLHSRSGSLLGDPHLSLSSGLFDSSLVLTAGIRRVPNDFQNEIFLQDYFAPFDESFKRWIWSAAVEFRQVDQVRCIVKGSRTFGKTPGRDEGYGMLLGLSEGSGGIDLEWRVDSDIMLLGTAEYGENSSPTDLLKGSALFSRLSNKVYARSYGAKLSFSAFAVPWETSVQYSSWNGRFVGHVESWPFTTLAASMFQNRLNIRGGGTLSMIDVGLTSTLPLGPGSLTVGLTSYLVRSDLAVEHWEPEFLVLGVKNYRRDPLGITSAFLQNVQFQYGFSLAGLRWTIGVSQLIPVVVNYTTASSTGITSGTSSSSSVRLDGGRRYSVGVGI